MRCQERSQALQAAVQAALQAQLEEEEEEGWAALAAAACSPWPVQQLSWQRAWRRRRAQPLERGGEAPATGSWLQRRSCCRGQKALWLQLLLLVEGEAQEEAQASLGA